MTLVLWRLIPFTLSAGLTYWAAGIGDPRHSLSRWALAISLTVFSSIYWLELFTLISPETAITARSQMGGVLGWSLVWVAWSGGMAATRARARARKLAQLEGRLRDRE